MRPRLSKEAQARVVRHVILRAELVPGYQESAYRTDAGKPGFLISNALQEAVREVLGEQIEEPADYMAPEASDWKAMHRRVYQWMYGVEQTW